MVFFCQFKEFPAGFDTFFVLFGSQVEICKIVVIDDNAFFVIDLRVQVERFQQVFFRQFVFLLAQIDPSHIPVTFCNLPVIFGFLEIFECVDIIFGSMIVVTGKPVQIPNGILNLSHEFFVVRSLRNLHGFIGKFERFFIIGMNDRLCGI
ncbi:hypothetical protein D3C86_1508860 [compost metagenome]